MSNFEPIHEVTMYQARCTNCGTIEDDYGDYSAWSDAGSPIESVTENDGWFSVWTPNGNLTSNGYPARDLTELLCPKCQKCEVCGADDARDVNGEDHLVCVEHEEAFA